MLIVSHLSNVSFLGSVVIPLQPGDFFACMHVMYNYDSSFAITCCAWSMYSSGEKRHEVKTSVKCWIKTMFFFIVVS